VQRLLEHEARRPQPVLRQAVPGAAGIDHPVITGAGHCLQEDSGEQLGTIIADSSTPTPHATDQRRPEHAGQCATSDLRQVRIETSSAGSCDKRMNSGGLSKRDF
jgi:hypothetical protein